MSEPYGLGLLGFLARQESAGSGTLRLGQAGSGAGAVQGAASSSGEQEHSWTERAACVSADPEAFFPEPHDVAHGARRVCAGCPVRLDCLAEALMRDERYGIWGGLGARERGRLRRPVVGEPLGVVRRWVEQDDERRRGRTFRAKRRW